MLFPEESPAMLSGNSVSLLAGDYIFDFELIDTGFLSVARNVERDFKA